MDFFSSVVVFGSKTTVDTQELLQAHLEVRAWARQLLAVSIALNRLVDRAGHMATILSRESGTSYATFNDYLLVEKAQNVSAVCQSLVQECCTLAYSYQWAAAVYASVEGNAAALIQARGDARIPWSDNSVTGRLLTDNSEMLRIIFSQNAMAGIFYGLHELVSERNISTALTFVLHSKEFSKGAGDGTVGLRAQFDIADVAERITPLGIAGLPGNRQERREAGQTTPAVTAVALGAGVAMQGLASQQVNVKKTKFTPAVYGLATHPSVLLTRIGGMTSKPGKAKVDIVEHQQKDGKGKAWSVVIRGTQEWSPGSTNPQDLLSNVQAVGGLNSAGKAVVLEAMAQAGIQPEEPVELIGHSQGGIIAAQITKEMQSAPPELQEYNIVSTLTAGAPTASYVDARGVLALENTRDLVPALEGAPSRWEADSQTVYFDSETLGKATTTLPVSTPHDVRIYADAMGRLETGNRTPREVQDWLKERSDAMQIDDRYPSRIHHFEGWRSDK